MKSFLDEKDLHPYAAQPLERRQEPRITCESLPFEDHPFLELGNVTQRLLKMKVRVLNISLGGVCIELPQSEELPNFFQLSVKLPSHLESLPILGEVVWKYPNSSLHMRRYGISFVSMTDENRERIRRFLERKPVNRVRSKENQLS